MKKVSFIISMLAINIFCINAQDCNNYYETEGTDNDPGIYGVGDFSVDYNGNNQEVKLGIYGFFEGWSNDSQADQTFFSVNGSLPVALSELSDFPIYIDGVFVTLNTISLNDEYIPNTSSSWISGTVKFIGAIDNITMTQFESGLLFSCVDSLEEISGCDYQFVGDDPGFPGYIITNAYPFDFSGEEMEVKIGYFDYVPFEEQGTDWPSDDAYFSVNGSELISVGTIYNNQPYMIGDVSITIDTMSIPEEYNVPENMISGTVIFNGEIDLIVTHQVESGIKFICVDEGEGVSDCIDYTENNGTPDFPGVYNSGNFSMDYDGSNQIVDLGIYHIGWAAWSNESGEEPNQTLFSVNGSDPMSVVDILTNGGVTLNGVAISEGYNTITYFYDQGLNYQATVLRFSGVIENITMTQMESGLMFSCVEEPIVIEDCNYEFNLDDSPEDGVLHGVVSFAFDENTTMVQMGYFDYVSWDEHGAEWPVDQTYFAVNGSELFTLENIYDNLPFEIGNVTISIDTTALASNYNVPLGMHSGTISLSGPVVSIITSQVESGIKFICTEEQELQGDCIDYTVDNNDPNFPGIYGGSDVIVPFDGSYQTVTMGVYGLFDNWSTSGQQNQTIFNFENGQSLSLKYIQENVPMLLGDLFIDMDLTSLNEEYLSQSSFDWTSATISFTGEIGEIIMTQFESGLLFSCTEPAFVDDCVDYTEWNSNPSLPGIWLLWDDYTLNYDSTYQEVSLGVYGVFADWIADSQGGLLSYASININGEYVTLESIVLNSPYTFNDIVIELDTNAIPGDYLYWDGTNTGTITLTGNIGSITLNQMEWGLLTSCSQPVDDEESNCLDYTEDNNNPNAPGIYLIDGDYQMDFDSTHQEVSLGVYGFFDWTNIGSGQADQTYFSVNGGNSVSFETIYLNQPYIIDGIELTVDTNALNSDYPLAEFWPSGTLILTGHISQVIMNQFESGLLFSCSNPADEECECDECICQIDADFSFVNTGSYYSFVSSGTGTQYSWDFGDGSLSSEENPAHQFAFPNAYNVCMTNFNLTDTCSITICKSIEFMANTPESNIITPNNDGYDDQVKLNCGNVAVYDRNGIVVAELISQFYWQGTNSNGQVLPMGEYILKCKETDVIRKITVIR